MIKMYCVFSPEALKLMGDNRGKCAAQSGHAYLHAWWNSIQPGDSDRIARSMEYYHSNDARKIALLGESEDQLRELERYYAERGVGVSLVEDCGYTVFEQPTITCLGIGPLDDDQKCETLKSLPLFI